MGALSTELICSSLLKCKSRIRSFTLVMHLLGKLGTDSLSSHIKQLKRMIGNMAGSSISSVA